ncbi:MAG: HEPN domain-containing protein [Candidatus Omnitrophica bacterium]|nr:HEPN domain-containing protein [Candidatus Omnitrophota bacterium]
MVSKVKTKDVSKSLYVNFLKRAEECFHAAQSSSSVQEWNAATINAIHCCIAACDAMCVYYLGKRFTGEKHQNAVDLFKVVKSGDENLNTNANRILRILRIKNMAEYEERLVYRSEAEKVLKDSQRLLEYVKKELP